jgi:hypothetical protein
MADINIQLLILLDPRNSHSCYEAKINRRIFKRCKNSQECRAHIVNQVDRDKHLFLPDFETELAEHASHGVSDTHVYLYCHSEDSADLIQSEWPRCALNRIFTIEELPFYLCHAGIELLHKLLRKPPSELNERERDELVQMAKQQLTELGQLYDQYMSEQLSTEVVDQR